MPDFIFNDGVEISAPSTELSKVCESIETLEGLLDSGASSITQDGQTVAFDHDTARRRLRTLYNQKAKLETEAGTPTCKRRTLVNRIKLS